MRLLVALLVVLLLLLQYALWLAPDGVREVWRLEDAVAEQEAENERLDERNEALRAEVKDLKTGVAAIEERARSELGMIREGETFYQVVEGEAGRGE